MVLMVSMPQLSGIASPAGGPAISLRELRLRRRSLVILRAHPSVLWSAVLIDRLALFFEGSHAFFGILRSKDGPPDLILFLERLRFRH